MQNANYSYPFHHNSPLATTPRQNTSSRTQPLVPTLHDAAGGHARRESRFDDAFEEPDIPREAADGEEKVETMVDFLASPVVPRKYSRIPFGEANPQQQRQTSTAAVSVRSTKSPKSSRRTPNRLRRSPGKEPRGLISLHVGSTNPFQGKTSIKPSSLGNTQKQTRRPLEDRSDIQQERAKPEGTISKKKSILDFAAGLGHKSKPTGEQKSKTVFGKFGKRKPMSNEVSSITLSASIHTAHHSNPTTSSVEIRESIDSEYSFIDSLPASPTDYNLPREESLWGEQDGGVRRVGKKKSFAGVGILGIMKGLQGRKESARGEFILCYDGREADLFDGRVETRRIKCDAPTIETRASIRPFRHANDVKHRPRLGTAKPIIIHRIIPIPVPGLSGCLTG